MKIEWSVLTKMNAVISQAVARLRLPQALIALIVLFLAANVLAACAAEMPEASYENLDAAIADGAVERGWVPDWLPPSALDIKEKHDLDTNSQIMRFTAPSWNGGTLPDHCRPVESTEPSRLTAPWWPENVGEMTAEVFVCDGGFLAFNASHGYFWRP